MSDPTRIMPRMQNLGSLLDTLPLPDDVEVGDPAALDLGRDCGADERLRELGADLPAGHLHVWGGPSGAGKTSFLLSLLHCAALRNRPVVYATYDLPPSGLALRLLAMLADVDVGALPDPGGRADTGGLTREQAARVVQVRAALRDLPFWILPSRGFPAASLADRLVRAPVRAEVLVVDYVQAVIREPGSELGVALRELSALAVQQHVAVVGVFRADGVTQDEATTPEVALQEAGGVEGASVDVLAARVGWIAPADGSGARRAEVISNRYGDRPSVPLRIDPATGRVETMPEDGPTAGTAAP